MALRLSLGWPQEAVLLEESVADAMAGGARTADIAAPGSPSISCSQMGDAVLAALEARCSAPRRSQTAAR
jgi:3-isopropylmalate dehydrogenase